MTKNKAIGASFRDPAGYVFCSSEGEILRQINPSGAADYDLLMKSGLYDSLTKAGLLVKHEAVPKSKGLTKDAHAVIKPTYVPYISYPFEWSFSQLKDAALLTLSIQKMALQHGMSLKDASAYNVQFVNGKPVFIDTLSFEEYTSGKPWQAYRQFCQHFLAPLALMAYTDVRLLQLLRTHIDGVPLDLATKLLPRKAKLRPGLAMHLVLHAKAQKSKESEHKQPDRPVAQSTLEAIIASLERLIKKLQPLEESTEWKDYYNNTNYTVSAADEKAKLLSEFFKPLKINTALDLGGNNGKYSRVLNKIGIKTICADIDPNAVEANYRYVRQQQEQDMLPLLIDLTNPGGSIGWRNDEREPIHQRLKCDAVVALAIIHHITISNNVPFEKSAAYLSEFAPYLAIEFVPKEDSQVQKLLATRQDIFPDYHKTGFKKAYEQFYTIEKESLIEGTTRTLFLLKRKQ